MKAAKVLIAMPMADEVKARLESQFAPGKVCYAEAGNVDKAQVAGSEVVIGNVPPALLAGEERLKWVQLNSAGTDGYTQNLSKYVKLTNATGAYGLAISEYMLAGLLGLYKQLPAYYTKQKTHCWQPLGQDSVRSIDGATILILGLGDIGGAFASRVKALGAYTIGIRRQDTRRPPYLDELYLSEQLDEVIGRADVVAMSLPNTKDTRKIIDRRRLSLMKPGAVLINVGRGNAVDSDALNEALRAGRLSGAVLDVTDPEPLPAEHPLWDAPNVLITPHISGGYTLHATYLKIIALIEENVRRFLTGEELINQVDFTTGYRKL